MLLLTYVNYGINILIMNVLVYLSLTTSCFLIILLIDAARERLLNNLKNLMKYPFLKINLITLFLSLAGIPPLLGFGGKFLLLLYLFTNNAIFIVIVFILLNVYVLYFYLQNIRFFTGTQSNTITNLIFASNQTEAIYNKLVLLMFINIFGILYLNNIIIYIGF